MWEVRAADAAAAAALAEWLLTTGLDSVAGQPGYDRAEVFSGPEDRVVLLTWWRGSPVSVPDPPPNLLARPPHAWDFDSAGVRS